MSILTLYLCLVSVIGLSFGPLEDLSFRMYNYLSKIGTNPSFTPITKDMSMMTSDQGTNHFVLPLHLNVKTQDQEFKTILGEEMNLYLLKIPIILLMEQASENVDLKEARYALCRSLGRQVAGPIRSFSVSKGSDRSDLLFEREFSCEDIEFRR